MATRLCPISALEPMRIMGIKQETLAYATLMFGSSFMVVNPIASFGVSFGLAILGEWLSKGKPGNYVMHKLSVEMNASRLAHRFPGIKTATSVAWKEAGLLPPPTAQSFYEPS